MEHERITREEPSQRAIWKYLSPVLYQAKRVPSVFVGRESVHVRVNERKRIVECGRSKGAATTELLTIMANVPIPATQDSFFLEVRLLRGNNLFIGMCCNGHRDLTDAQNYSYSCNDGNLHIPGVDYSRQDVHKDDVVGVFYNRRERSILFTINRTLGTSTLPSHIV